MGDNQIAYLGGNPNFDESNPFATGGPNTGVGFLPDPSGGKGSEGQGISGKNPLAGFEPWISYGGTNTNQNVQATNPTMTASGAGSSGNTGGTNMAITSTTSGGAASGASTLPSTGGTSSSTLSQWAGPYVTQMLGRAQALSELPYQVYQGPLTAGETGLQSQAFKGIGALTMPGEFEQAGQTFGQLAGGAGQGGGYTPTTYGSTFQAPGAYQPVGGSFTDQGIAQQYMNPYMQQVLNPQLQALQRQADIQRNALGAQTARQGAFGGARAGLMGQQIGAELMRQQQQATGQAYGQAFGQAQQQYNTEQARRAQEAQFGAGQGMNAAQLAAQYGLAGQQLGEQARQFGADYGLRGAQQRLQAAQALQGLGQTRSDIARQNLAQQLAAGSAQRGIQQEGITAALNEFNAQRDYPMRQVQFLQSMLQGLPISTVTTSPAQMSGLGQLSSTIGGIGSLLTAIKNLNLGGG